MRTQRQGARHSGSGRPVVGRWGALLVGLVAAMWQVASVPVVSCAAAQEGASGQARKWALLIGVEKYHRAPPLRHTVNDVRQLAEALLSRGDYAEENLLEIVDTEPNPRFQPLRASLMAELPAFLAKPGVEDSVLVYFSGHGFQDKEGKLYLAPIDCDPADAKATGMAVEWFRGQIASCKATTKVLILDACHAGGEKGEDDQAGVSAKDLGAPFQDLSGVVTLASSTAEERSQIWEEKQQSLFSYWLNQALRGHADRDSDGSVTIDEIYAYVYRQVTQTAKGRFPKSQTPVRIVRPGTVGVPEVVHLKPQGLRQVLADIAEQLSWSMEERRLAKMGVLEFTNDTRIGELLGADFGLLGKYCAEELERRLMDLGTGKFELVDRRRLQRALKDQAFAIADLGSPEKLGQLAKRADGLPVLALGTLQNRAGRMVSLQCRLVQTQRDEVAGIAGGMAALNESEWAMLGRSVQVRPEDRRPELPTSDEKPRPMDEVVIERLDRRAEAAHPLLDPAFPFRVRIMVETPGRKSPVERQPVFRGNDMFVPLKKGEVYQIWVDNNSKATATMRLLVDGLNTLPEKPKTKDMVVEGTENVAAPLASDVSPSGLATQRVNLDEARHYILDPERGKTQAIRGFRTDLKDLSKYNEFKVVDAQQSLAARQQFTDQIGLITTAFYAPKSDSRAIGTGLGQERKEKLEERKGVKCGNLLGVVHIRYVEPEALEAIE